MGQLLAGQDCHQNQIGPQEMKRQGLLDKRKVSCEETEKSNQEEVELIKIPEKVFTGRGKHMEESDYGKHQDI